MKNLTFKAAENSKNTSGESGNNPAGGSGQLTAAQVANLVQVAADMGCTHFQTHFFMDTEAEMVANYVAYTQNYNLRTMYQDIQLWADLIHAAGMRHVLRGSWSGIKGNNNFGFVKYGTGSFVPLGTSGDAAGGSTYCAKLRRFCETVGASHFESGDVFAPVSEATEFLSNANYTWFDTSAGTQAGFYSFFTTMHDAVDAYGASIGKTFGYMTIVNYSEYSSGYVNSTLPADTGILPIDYYGHRLTSVGGQDALPSSYVADWTAVRAAVGAYPLYQTEMGGIFGDSWPTLGINNALRSPRVNTYEESAHYQVRFWKAYRDSLVDAGLMNGVSNWGLWANQNSSIVRYSNGTYTPNYFGQIYANFLKGNGMARIPVPSTTSMDSWGNRNNYF